MSQTSPNRPEVPHLGIAYRAGRLLQGWTHVANQGRALHLAVGAKGPNGKRIPIQTDRLQLFQIPKINQVTGLSQEKLEQGNPGMASSRYTSA